MKLRFRENSLRLRVNQKEVANLASGLALQELVHFPGNTSLAYTLKPASAPEPSVLFSQGELEIDAPQSLLSRWAQAEEIGLYFSLPTSSKPLKVAIEKDLECVDGPLEEKDPHAFPRTADKSCG